jgi:accessory gene regulator B
MEKLVKILAFRLSKLSNKHSSIFSDNFKIDYYLFQAILSDLLKVLIALGINFIFGTVTGFLIIVAIFGSLRFLTGGFHASSFNSCMIITLSLFITTPIIARLLYNNIKINMFYLTGVMIFCLILDILYSPRFLVELEKRVKYKYKIFSIIYLILIYILAFKYKQYSITVYIAIIIQLITVTPMMYVISNKLKNRGDVTL